MNAIILSFRDPLPRLVSDPLTARRKLEATRHSRTWVRHLARRARARLPSRTSAPSILITAQAPDELPNP